MKVLFCSYPHVGISQGGMFLQIKHTAEALSRRGVDVAFHDTWSNKLREVEICHFFSTHHAHFGLFKAALDHGVPCVWSNVLSIFAKSILRLRCETFFSKKVKGFLPAWKEAAELAERSHSLIALNEQEAAVLATIFPRASAKIVVIPNGVDQFMAGGNADLFRKAYDLPERRCVVNVGKVWDVKNQLKLIEAAKGQDWTLVIVGELNESAYAMKCRDAARGQKNVILTGAFPYGSPLLSGAFAAADVFCLPSLSEVQPLTLIEAAQNNCNIVVSGAFPLQSFLKPHAIAVDPKDPLSIRAGIARSLAMGPTGSGAAVRSQPTWDEVGAKISEIYHRCLRPS